MTEYPWHVEIERRNKMRIVVVAPTGDIDFVYRRIGQMALSNDVNQIIVYRDRQEYRHYTLKKEDAQ